MSRVFLVMTITIITAESWLNNIATSCFATTFLDLAILLLLPISFPLVVHGSSLPVAHPGYQALSDILFRLGLIANALTVQFLVQFSDCRTTAFFSSALTCFGTVWPFWCAVKLWYNQLINPYKWQHSYFTWTRQTSCEHIQLTLSGFLPPSFLYFFKPVHLRNWRLRYVLLPCTDGRPLQYCLVVQPAVLHGGIDCGWKGTKDRISDCEHCGDHKS